MSDKAKIFLKASKKIWGDQLDYSLVDYKGQRKETTLTCIKHQIDFQQTPNSNLNGVKGCWKCSRKPKNSDNLKELLQENFQNEYDYSEIEYDGKKTTEITLKCDEHGDFTRPALELINGKHCKQCMTGITRKEFLKRAEKHHGLGKYDYSKVSYKYSTDKITVTCLTHGDFNIEVSGLLRGHGCKDCAKLKRRITFENFLERAIESHNQKYEYSKDYWVSGETLTKIKCKQHGWFSINWFNHVQGGGCKRCSLEESRLPLPEVQERLKAQHQDQYSIVEESYESLFKTSKIICKDHGMQETQLSNVTRGQRLSCCYRASRQSKLEKEVLDFIKNTIEENIQNKESVIETSNRSILKGQEIDIYIPELRLGIEVNGDYWHSDEFLKNSKNITAKEYHESKQKLAKEQGVTLLYVWESDWSCNKENIKKLLKKIIQQVKLNNKFNPQNLSIPEIFLKTTNNESYKD